MNLATRLFVISGLLALAPSASAVEVTVKNDSITDFSNAVIVTGFVFEEKAASWLTSPCNGNVRAVQIFWRSQTGTSPFSIEGGIEISRAGTFPNPGALQTAVLGPVMNDGVFNEFRFVDENNTIPINVPVTMNETFVIAFQFSNPPPSGVGPSVLRDTNGIVPARNAIFASLGGGSFIWFDAATLGVTGDWAIRAVVDCPVVPNNVDVSVAITANPNTYQAGQTQALSIVVGNAGPASANGTTIVDLFPAALTNVSWTCSGTNGATCPNTGSGNITNQVNLPVNSAVTFAVSSVVASNANGPISNSATAVVANTLTDTMPNNNTQSIDLMPANLGLFANGFE